MIPDGALNQVGSYGLRPCQPKCDREKLYLFHRHDFILIECLTCQRNAKAPTEEEAIEQWNKNHGVDESKHAS